MNKVLYYYYYLLKKLLLLLLLLLLLQESAPVFITIIRKMNRYFHKFREEKTSLQLR